VVNDGSHRAFGTGLRPLLGWFPIDVLHFPFRSYQQFERKLHQWWELIFRGGGRPSSFRGAAHEAYRQGRLREFYDSLVVDGKHLTDGVADGTLAVDTRLREALRSGRPDFAAAEADSAYLAELDRLAGADDLAVTQRRIGELETRLAAQELGLVGRVRRLLAAR
jgi:hypothetical protein